MDLPLTADWLVPLGAGLVVLAALTVLVLAMLHSSRQRRQGEPTADGTQHRPPAHVERSKLPEPAPEPQAVPTTTSFAAVPAHWSGGSRPAGAAAVPPVVEQAPAEPEHAAPEMAPPPAGPPSGPVPVGPWDRVGDADAIATNPQFTDVRYGDTQPGGQDHVGSSRTVAAAVAQAFAVRTAAGRPGGPEQPPREPVRRPEVPMTQAPSYEPQAYQPAEPPREQEVPRKEQQMSAAHSDVRDRLLAVLLDDPALAVDATVALDACRAQLERLSHAVRHERGVLGEILQRLAGTGLRADQLARLAGMPVDEVQALLAPASSR